MVAVGILDQVPILALQLLGKLRVIQEQCRSGRDRDEQVQLIRRERICYSGRLCVSDPRHPGISRQ